MKIEKDDRKVEKSYLIENWLTLNKTPFSQWKTEMQHKNLLLMCLEIFEEMETELRKEKIPVKMDFREIAEDKEILCTCQVQAAVCAFFYVLVCEIHPVQVLFSGKDQTLSRYIRYRSFSQEKTKHCPSQQQAVQEKRKERQTVKGWEQAGGWRFSICNLWDMT